VLRKPRRRARKYPTPVEAIRAHCLDCVGSAKVVRKCAGEYVHNTGAPCPLFPWRFGCSPELAARRGESVSCDAPRMSAMQAMRAECLSCCCEQANEVALCPSKGCSLWPYRFGLRPETARARGHIVDRDRFVLVRTDLDPVSGGMRDYAMLADGSRLLLPVNAWRRMGEVTALNAEAVGERGADGEATREDCPAE